MKVRLLGIALAAVALAGCGIAPTVGAAGADGALSASASKGLFGNSFKRFAIGYTYDGSFDKKVLAAVPQEDALSPGAILESRFYLGQKVEAGSLNGGLFLGADGKVYLSRLRYDQAASKPVGNDYYAVGAYRKLADARFAYRGGVEVKLDPGFSLKDKGGVLNPKSYYLVTSHVPAKEAVAPKGFPTDAR